MKHIVATLSLLFLIVSFVHTQNRRSAYDFAFEILLEEKYLPKRAFFFDSQTIENYSVFILKEIYGDQVFSEYSHKQTIDKNEYWFVVYSKTENKNPIQLDGLIEITVSKNNNIGLIIEKETGKIISLMKF
jgi:hypothetical protein